MDEENKNETQEAETAKEEDKPISIVDEARAIRDEIKAEKEAVQAEREKLEKIQSEALLSGTGGNVETKPKEETAVEYKDRIMRGEK